MTLVLDNEFKVVDNLETIQYRVKTAADTWATTLTVPNVLRRARDKTFADGDKNLNVQEIVFHIWANQLAAVPKINDKITDADGLKYVVREVEVHCFYTRYRLTCIREQ